jgi:hypothetical protein
MLDLGEIGKDLTERLASVAAGELRATRGRGLLHLKLSDPSWIAPGVSSHMVARPHGRPFRASRILAEVRVGDPSIDHFRRGRRAGGSRRRGRLASQAWAATCLLVRQHPERFRPRASLDSLIIAGREHLLAPLPIDLFTPDRREAGAGLSLSACPADRDVCVTIANHDFRPVRAAVVLVGGDPDR